MVNKTLVLNGFELDLKLNSFKKSSFKISSERTCLKCNSKIQKVDFCVNCNKVLDKTEIKTTQLNNNKEEIDLTEIKKNLINPIYIVGLKPISKKGLQEQYNKPLLDYSVYNISPSEKNELPFNYLCNFLKVNDIILPIEKFRYNKNSMERSGYIEYSNGFLLFRVLLSNSEYNEIQQADITEVETESFSKLMNNSEFDIKAVDIFQKLDLLKPKTERKNTKESKNNEFLKLIATS